MTLHHGARTSIAAVVAGAALLLGGACGAPASPTISGTNTYAARLAVVAAPDRPAGQVVAISVDGLRPSVLRDLGRKGTPALHRMIRQGASTLNARTLREITVTLPNHTTMLTGRRATGERGHGVVVNVDPGGTVHDAAGRRINSMFDVVHDNGGRTALYASKEKFALFNRSWGQGPPRRDAIDRYHYDAEPALVTQLVERLQTRNDALSFLHLGLPDAAGHEHGFGSSEYRSAVRRMDTLVGRIVRTVASRPSLRKDTTVILTSDHGGSSNQHGDPTQRAHFTIPFIVWGAQAGLGTDLYRLNPRREDPGAARTDYRGPGPVRNGDLANLATDLLGLPPVSGSMFNRDQALQVHGGAPG